MTYIGLAIQTQIVVSTVFAYFLFKEMPVPLQIVGSIAIIGGVMVATLGQRRKPAPATPLSETVAPVTTGD
jgi:drug/metabolite transporter (DMT)-like permease